jgi:hypothetical protein
MPHGFKMRFMKKWDPLGSLIGGIYIIPGDATMGIIMFDMLV